MVSTTIAAPLSACLMIISLLLAFIFKVSFSPSVRLNLAGLFDYLKLTVVHERLLAVVVDKVYTMTQWLDYYNCASQLLQSVFAGDQARTCVRHFGNSAD